MNLFMWREIIGCCFCRRPQAKPSEMGLAWACHCLFELLRGLWGHGRESFCLFFTSDDQKGVLEGLAGVPLIRWVKKPMTKEARS